jgi:AcrR family transcriptional regulator
MNKRFERAIATRRHILAVATRLFAERGYEATSIEAVLKACGISRGALYHHFGSKQELFQAVFEQIEERIAEATVKASRGISDPKQSLRAGCLAFLNLARDARVKQIALIDAPSALGWQKWREIEERHGLGLLKRALKAAAKTGKLRASLSTNLRTSCSRR